MLFYNHYHTKIKVLKKLKIYFLDGEQRIFKATKLLRLIL